MQKNIFVFLGLMLLCPAGGFAMAGEPGLAPFASSPEPNQFLQDAEDHRRGIEGGQRERQLQRGQPTAPAGSASPEPPDDPDAPCWYVSGLRLTGNRLIGDEPIRLALQPLLKPCLSAGQVNRLLTTLTALYIDAGYVASRPFLLAPPADGQPLELAVEEGFVEAIQLAGADLPVSLGAAFPGMLGKPLNLRALEQGLDQLNRLRSVDLAADIEPGQLTGGSRIVLRALSRLPRWQLGAGLDNSGSDSTGRNRLSLTAGLDSPLERNDFLSLYGTRSHAAGEAGSDTLGLYYSLPYGPWTLALSANHFRYQSIAYGNRQTIATRGASTLFSYSLERALWRDQQRLLSATLRLDDKRTLVSLAGQRLGVQSPRYQSVEAGLNGVWLGQATWTAFAGYSHGLGGWSANDPRARKLPGAPNARFGKWRASLSRTTRHTLGGLHCTLMSSWHGQYSTDPLPTTEGLSLGSPSLVRGFQGQPLDSASGLAWRNTLYLPFSLGHGLRLTPSLGLDAGWAEGRGRLLHPRGAGQRSNPARGERLVGASLGASLEHRNASLVADYQRGLYRRNGPLDTGYWQLALQLRY